MKTLLSDSKKLWNRFSRKAYLLAFLSVLSGCTTVIPRSDLPIITNESCGEQVKVVTVPLPVIATSPNEGITAGALSAFLIHNQKDEVYSLLAPQINHNKNFGFTGTLYGSVNPTADQNIEFNLSQSQKKNFDYEARIRRKNGTDLFFPNIPPSLVCQAVTLEPTFGRFRPGHLQHSLF